ncbi:YgjV family protein [Actinomyces sp. 594]|nr:YgjV family protein [Actinomyces sp. 594]
MEIVGWAGSGLVIVSLVVANQRTFRRLNLAGSLIATAYNLVLGVWPAVGMNATIALIDLYWLIRLRRSVSPLPESGEVPGLVRFGGAGSVRRVEGRRLRLRRGRR